MSSNKNPISKYLSALKQDGMADYVLEARQAIIKIGEIYSKNEELAVKALEFSDDADLTHDVLRFLYMGCKSIGLFLDEQQISGNKDGFMQMIKDTTLFSEKQLKNIEDSIEF